MVAKKPFFNIKQALQVAQGIKDPAARQKEFDRIQRLVIGTEPQPNMAARLTADPATGRDTRQPTAAVSNVTMKDAADQQRLIQEMELADKMQPKQVFNGPAQEQHPEAYTDAELQTISEGFAGPQEAARAQSEIATRGRIDEKGFSKLFDPAYINRLAGNVVGGAANIPTSQPIGMAGLLALGGEKLTGANLGSKTLLDLSSRVRSGVNDRIGISEPRDVGESIAGLIPNIIPIPGSTAPVSMVGNVAEIATPFVFGAGKGRVAANFTASFLADQAIREVQDDATSPYKTVFDQLGMVGKDIAHPELATNLLGAAGLLMGGSVLTSAGIKQMRAYKAGKAPPIDDVINLDANAPKGLKTLETAADQRNAFLVDTKSVLSNLARRAGIPDFDTVRRLIDNDTQVAGTMRVNEAMHTGNLNTYGGRWHVDTTPHQLRDTVKRLPQAMQVDADEYVKWLNLHDMMQMRIDAKKGVSEAERIQQQAARAIQTIRQRTPIVDQIAQQYRHITGSVRDYLGQGPSAMLSRKRITTLGRDNPNFVPRNVIGIDPSQGLFRRMTDAGKRPEQSVVDGWYRQKQDLMTVTDIDRQSNAFDILIDYTHNALKSKMMHDVRGAYVRAMRKSQHGAETLLPANAKMQAKHKDRLIEVYDKGKLKHYVSSQLQRDLLQFDPYAPKFKVAYGLKRAFEMGITGPASMIAGIGGFAVTTLIRDVLGGSVFLPKGYRTKSGMPVLTAIPKILLAKAQLAAFNAYGKNFEHMPFLSTANKTNLAAAMSKAYENSFYHIFNEAGGYSGSLQRTAVEAGRSKLTEIAKSADWLASRMSTMPGKSSSQFMGNSLGNMVHGMVALFDAMSEAPRFAASESGMRAGKSATEAVSEARRLTGDNTRSGQVYRKGGKQQIGVDPVNKGIQTAGVSELGWATAAGRESIPWTNPTIQGIRQLGQRLIESPVETNLKAWTTVGLPSMVVVGWNEMLGEEYNKFAFEQRSSRDIATKMYIGIPGMPPERGIQIPMPLELGLWMSPFTTGMYSILKGAEDGGEVRSGMMSMAAENLKNSGMIGFPQLISIPFAGAMVNTPESVINPFDWMNDTYKLREDNVGFFPENLERVVRATWGATGDHALNTIAALHDGGPEAFFQEMLNGMVKRTPILRDVAGTTTPVSNFTPLSEKRRTKVEALQAFNDLYDEHVNPETAGTFGVKQLPSAKGMVDDNDPADSRALMAPLKTPKPTNPLVYIYGDLIKTVLDSNEEGYKGLSSRYTVVSKQLDLLKAYGAGNANSFKEWQKTYQGADKQYQTLIKPILAEKAAIPMRPDDPTKAAVGYGDDLDAVNAKIKHLDRLAELAKNDRLINGMHLDLSKRGDVKKLVGVLEKERGELMNEQIKLIGNVEDRVNEDMKIKGMLLPNQRFSIEKHLGSFLEPGLLAAPAGPAGPR